VWCKVYHPEKNVAEGRAGRRGGGEVGQELRVEEVNGLHVRKNASCAVDIDHAPARLGQLLQGFGVGLKNEKNKIK
jgi:hypothetical protein